MHGMSFVIRYMRMTGIFTVRAFSATQGYGIHRMGEMLGGRNIFSMAKYDLIQEQIWDIPLERKGKSRK
jgi:hypothetical protein